MAIPRVYLDEPCPLEGYESLTVRILANPTGAEWADWQTGHLGITGCAECAKVQPAPRGRRAASPAADAPRVYCASCASARDRFARACVAFYGPTVLDLDCSTPEATLTSLDGDTTPDELLYWLLLLPESVWTRRRAALGKTLGSSSTSAS